jgi:CDP-glycerol glycerophosphotransferase (TagB/SpsB family)
VSRILVGLLIVAAVLAASCNRAAEPDLTTTSTTAGGGVTTSTTVAEDEDAPADTTTSVAGQEVTEHEVVARIADQQGESQIVVIPPGDYTDQDLRFFVEDLAAETSGLHTLHVFDDREAAEAFQVPEGDRSEEQQQLVDEHYLVSLTDGIQLTFHGPYEDSGSVVIGS